MFNWLHLSVGTVAEVIAGEWLSANLFVLSLNDTVIATKLNILFPQASLLYGVLVLALRVLKLLFFFNMQANACKIPVLYIPGR